MHDSGTTGDSLLKVNNLRTYFFTTAGVVKAVDGISFSLNRGKMLGIVGESGCGKSVTALSIMRLISYPPGKIVSGEINFEDENILRLPAGKMRKIRGSRISMIFQEPMTFLNPVFRIGDQISEAIRIHEHLSIKESFNRATELLHLVGMPTPEKRAYDYPHQLSGGMRQRVMIAIAIACKPKLMIADEPTTALDVTIQAQILELIQKLKEEIGASVILVTHNMGVVSENVENVIVMYLGKIIEYASVLEIFENPCHPYTQGLLNSIPKINLIEPRSKLNVIPGVIPNNLDLPNGCKFNNRCSRSFVKCRNEEAPFFQINSEHYCQCWLYE